MTNGTPGDRAVPRRNDFRPPPVALAPARRYIARSHLPKAARLVITFVLVIHTLIAAALVIVILLQRSEGGGLGIGGGTGGGLMTARGAANLLTRSTTVLAVLFIGTSITLAFLAGSTQRVKPIDTSLARPVQTTPAQTAPAPAPAGVPLVPGTLLPGAPAPAPAAPAPAPAAPMAPVSAPPADGVPLAR